MRTVKINDRKYKVVKVNSTRFDSYYYKGVLYDNRMDFDMPTKGCVLEDGSSVGILRKRILPAPIKIAIGLILLSLLIGLIFKIITSSNKQQEKQEIDLGTVDVSKSSILPRQENVVLRYNKFLDYSNGKVNVNIINYDKTIKVSLTATNIECDIVTIEPEKELDYMNIKLLDDSEIINATLEVTIDKVTETYPVVISVAKDTQKLDGETTFSNEEVIHD